MMWTHKFLKRSFLHRNSKIARVKSITSALSFCVRTASTRYWTLAVCLSLSFTTGSFNNLMMHSTLSWIWGKDIVLEEVSGTIPKSNIVQDCRTALHTISILRTDVVSVYCETRERSGRWFQKELVIFLKIIQCLIFTNKLHKLISQFHMPQVLHMIKYFLHRNRG